MCKYTSIKTFTVNLLIFVYLSFLLIGVMTSNTSATPDFLHFIFILSNTTELILNSLLLTPLAVVFLTKWNLSKTILLYTAGPFLSLIVELFQNWIPGRTPSLRDVILNSSGYIFTIFLLTVFKRITN